LLMGYFSHQGGFPMTVGDSSVGGSADQFHTARWTLVMASVGVGAVKTLIRRLRYLAAVREQVAGTVSDPPAEILGRSARSVRLSAEGRLRP
jgi:hypothetical protein